jgi:hypothetical protein
MPYFVYDTEPKLRSKGGFFNPSDFDPVVQFMVHFENLLYLEFIQKSTDKFYERKQAEDEMVICKRKMTYWERQSDFDRKRAEIEIQKAKNKWK